MIATKQCPRCAREGIGPLPVTEFDKHRHNCRRHAASIRHQSRHDWYLRNKERLVAQAEQTRRSDPERHREYQRKYRERNRSVERARSRVTNAQIRKSKPWYRAFFTARQRASKVKVPFALTLEWAERTWTGECALTGLEFVQGKGCMGPYSPSLDRVRPELGYVPGNCRFILQAVNAFKSNGTDEQMFAIAKALIQSLNIDERRCAA